MEIRPNKLIRPAHLLTARREADYTDGEGRRDLWRTANVLQENLLQGGVQGRNERGRRVRTRPIKSVGEDVRVTGPLDAHREDGRVGLTEARGRRTAPVFPLELFGRRPPEGPLIPEVSARPRHPPWTTRGSGR